MEALAPSAMLPPDVRLTRDAPVTTVLISPWPPVQGGTSTIWLAGTAVTPTLQFGGRSYPAARANDAWWAPLPVAALAGTGPSTLRLVGSGSAVTLTVPVVAGKFVTETIPASASQPILSEAQRVQVETQRMTDLFARFDPGPFTPATRFRLPIPPGASQTSHFGTRRTYGDSSDISTHAGEDFGAASGTPVRAPAAGTVVLAEPLFVRGNAIVIDHGWGVMTGYWHLVEIGVRPGQKVAAGDLLGAVGSTGLSTGAHLHWEMRVQGVAVDPLQWLEQPE